MSLMAAEVAALARGFFMKLLHIRVSTAQARLVRSALLSIASASSILHVQSSLSAQAADAVATTASDDVVQIDPATPPPSAATCPPPDGTRPDPTLINTDAFVLQRFPLQRVYKQLLTLAHVNAPNAVEIFQQMWDSMDRKASAKFAAPHCDDESPPNINGFPLECPRPEISLKDAQPQSFIPVALVNRFDLAPANGANCGEMRMVYAMTPFEEKNRNLIIFESTLPNPNPSCGIDACRPVVQFWENLATLDATSPSGRAELAERLEQFYFRGLAGFGPVIAPERYGLGSTDNSYRKQEPVGQIRTNMFVSGTLWQMREFRLDRSGRGRSSRLLLRPAVLANNPFPPLFDSSNATPDPRAPEFQASFPDQIAGLANDDVNLIAMDIDPRYLTAQSTSSLLSDDYEIQLQNSAPDAFSAAIDTELARIGRTDLSALDIAERATTQSCGGCHQLAVGLPLSMDGTGTPVWPNSRPGGFVHIDENGFLSEALWCEFLPFRKSVLDGLYRSKPQACAPQSKTHPGGPRRVVVSQRPLALIRAIEAWRLTVSGKSFGPN
jgi:hypothetical protein